MKGLVLAGGQGKRLRPFTYTGAKQLVPVANKPVLFYALEQLAALGITDIAVVVGDTADEVRAAARDGSRFGVTITYLEQDAPRGVAHAILLAREWLGDSRFVMVLGDNLFRSGMVELVQRFAAGDAAAQVHLVHVPNPEAFGVAMLDGDGRLARLVEKPRTFISDLAVVGLYCFGPEVHAVVARQQPSARGELEITDAIQGLVDAGLRVDAVPVRDYWIDTGKMGDILDANRVLLEALTPRVDGEVCGESRLSGRVVIEKGARVVDSIINGPAIVGEGTVIERAYIGPFTSIYHSCHVSDAEIGSSVILERTTIAGVPGRIEDSLIGRDVQLSGALTRPRSYRLVLGDHSEARLP